MRRPVLLAVAHGSRSAAGVAANLALLERVRALRPALDVRCCFLDLARPSLPEALAALDGRAAVLVPLLLGGGYHLRVDLPQALAAAGLAHLPLARALGPHPLLATALADRLAAAGRPPGAGPVVLAASGSSDPAANAGTARLAALLAARLGDGRPVVPAYLSAARPTPAEAVAALHATGHHRVAVATHLLAPGFFATRAAATAAHWTSAPLGAHDALARLVVLRYEEAGAAAPAPVVPVRQRQDHRSPEHEQPARHRRKRPPPAADVTDVAEAADMEGGEHPLPGQQGEPGTRHRPDRHHHPCGQPLAPRADQPAAEQRERLGEQAERQHIGDGHPERQILARHVHPHPEAEPDRQPPEAERQREQRQGPGRVPGPGLDRAAHRYGGHASSLRARRRP
ncbi:CbiX/SirB N-terminal domain-containing protein [Kitasatospora sp. NPDC097605]|uniref:sirohydrochlorin chelatase n=1 Tax=Kitasatospora sp. NPDC097605 TaxID=3157226 RepID=UPI003316B0CD